MCGNGHPLETTFDEGGSLGIEARMQVVGHATDEETVVVLPLHEVEILVLLTVDELLHDDGCRHLGIIHIGDEHLRRVAAIDHEGGQHLHLLAEEHRPAVGQGFDALTVPRGVLSEP